MTVSESDSFMRKKVHYFVVFV